MLYREEVDSLISVLQKDRLDEVQLGTWTDDKQQVYCNLLSNLVAYRDMKAWGKQR